MSAVIMVMFSGDMKGYLPKWLSYLWRSHLKRKNKGKDHKLIWIFQKIKIKKEKEGKGRKEGKKGKKVQIIVLLT